MAAELKGEFGLFGPLPKILEGITRAMIAFLDWKNFLLNWDIKDLLRFYNMFWSLCMHHSPPYAMHHSPQLWQWNNTMKMFRLLMLLDSSAAGWDNTEPTGANSCPLMPAETETLVWCQHRQDAGECDRFGLKMVFQIKQQNRTE